MKDESKQCFRCKHFDALYIKGVKKFNRSKLGICFKSGECVNLHCTCDKFEFKPNNKKIRYSTMQCLNRLLTDISAIRTIIEEESGGTEEIQEV